MLEANSTNHIFRFVQLRPPTIVAESDQIPLNADTPLVARISDPSPRQRRLVAQAHLREKTPVIAEHLASETVSRLETVIDEVVQAAETVGNLGERLSRQLPALASVELEFSDFLLAAKFGREGMTPRLIRIARDYRVLYAVGAAVLRSRKLSEILNLPIVLPPRVGQSLEESRSARATPPSPAPPTPVSPQRTANASAYTRAYRALDELAALHRPEFLRLPETGEPAPAPDVPAMMLNGNGIAMLSRDTQGLLRRLGIDPSSQPIHSTVRALEAAIATSAELLISEAGEVPVPSAPHEPGTVAGAEVFPQVRPSGFAELMVLKQHLKGYQRTDISHVENVMAGESKTRTHRSFERAEQTFTVEREDIDEREHELQTAERFELKQEAETTISEDQRFGFGLSLSGRYGPSVEFDSSFEGELSNSSEEVRKSSVNYAKDVVERSLEKVTKRVRQEQIRRILREQEETNVHALSNETANHVSGVYQYLEKVYESQVFNYGLRQIFDFMVPEPASFVWYVQDVATTQLSLPMPPPKLETFVQSAEFVDEYKYLQVGAALGATDLAPPPPPYRMVTTSLKHGDETADEEGHPSSVLEKEIAIPDGYAPFWALVRPSALTDDAASFAITVGTANTMWRPTGVDVGSDHSLSVGSIGLSLLEMGFAHDAQSKVSVQMLAYESNTYAATFSIIFVRKEEALKTWQIKTYGALQAAWQARQLKYEQDVEQLRQQASSTAARLSFVDNAPSQNAKLIRNEFKKHCISILTTQRYDAFQATADGPPPFFDFAAAAEEGAFIRFFEQAFEWDQLQYVCYPYYWARKSTWEERFQRNEVDPVFLDFVQAGAARVVIPVRPGFEAAVLHYLETTDIWNGQGVPATVNSPLYVPIITELSERAGAPGNETPVGEAWTTVVPTPLVILRRETSLPAWERTSPDGWEWREAPGS
jgi:hypothetical protein